jgi:predicted MFS family arabinose efflux permease
MGFNGPVADGDGLAVDARRRSGRHAGARQSLASLGRVVGPVWGGFLFDRYGMTTPYLSAAAIMFVAVAVAVASLRSAPPATA